MAASADSDVLTILDHVDAAIRHGLVEVGDAHASAYRFVHALVRETLYDELPPGRAARLHAAIASALERLDPPPAEALRDVSANWRVTPAWGAELVPLWWSLWSTMMTRGDLPASAELAEELLDQAVASGDPAGLVAGHVAVAYTGLFAGADLESVLERLELAAEAEAAAEPASLAPTPEHLGVSCRVNLAIAHALRGDPEVVATACRDLVTYSGRVGGAFQEAYAHLFAGWAIAATGRPEEALEFGTAGLARCDEARLGYVAHLITPVHAWAAARCGADPRDQAARVGAAIDALQAAGQSHAVANWLLLQAEFLAMAGDAGQAEVVLARAEALGRDIGEMVYEPQLRRVRAMVRP